MSFGTSFLLVLGLALVVDVFGDQGEAKIECSAESKLYKEKTFFNGKKTTCTCKVVTDDVNQPSWGRWYEGSIPIESVDGNIILTTNDEGRELTCKGLNDDDPQTTLKPAFAYIDPDSVFITTNKNIVKLCGNDDEWATLICTIDKRNVNPEPKFSFAVINDPVRDEVFVTSNDTNHTDEFYRSYFTPMTTEYRTVYYACRAELTYLFSDLYSVTSYDAWVSYIKPPEEPPKVSIQGHYYQGLDNVVPLTTGPYLEIACFWTTPGQTKSATNITCDNGLSKIERLTFASMKVQPLTAEMDQVKCSCSGTHESGCYDKVTEVTLQVNYSSDLIMDDLSQAAFNEGDSTILNCSVRSNPPSSLVLTRERTGDVLADNADHVKSKVVTFELTSLKCLDTGVYVCIADNGQGPKERKTHVYVPCPHNLINKPSVPSKVFASIGEVKTFAIEIAGYPAPTSITVKTTAGYDRTGSSHFNVTYRPLQLPVGKLEFTVDGVINNDFQKYEVTIDNGVGSPLVYTFDISQDPAGRIPLVTIDGKQYQGFGNTVHVTAGYVGDLTCTGTREKFRPAKTTHIECDHGSVNVSAQDNLVTTKFDPLTSVLDEAECFCSATLEPGSINKRTEFTMDVSYISDVSMTITPSQTAIKGDHRTITCSVQGNPPPTLVLTKERTGEVLVNESNEKSNKEKSKQLTYEIISAVCLDTDFYVCTATNDQGRTVKKTRLYVQCPPFLHDEGTAPSVVKASLGEIKEVSFEVAGFPQPETVAVADTASGKDLTGLHHFNVHYIPTQFPVVKVKVTIDGVTDEDYRSYTIGVYNGIGDALFHTFELRAV